MTKVALKYHFTFPDSRERTFELALDRTRSTKVQLVAD